ncbi:DEAD/DEAH box helicase [Acidithiobacillus sulfurivorans]|uniref:DEAD/DEAH box helicase family protein n=1 Tax=Acidithiobacillus sulfurivorans TaxID=1958756 RepID=A0ABS5ZUE4_9PROT|nr:DEAD/DEAH box helicase family protein [Acidithiobacillus sulfurivorans]MBU2758799.1 DEAD/DEAH box helicase family protein [Acidithiobacillus sulfurivorans]
MPIDLKDFQNDVLDGMVARFENVRALYERVERDASLSSRILEARQTDGALVLQAPTGSGKTILAVEMVRRLSARERILWFWFAPYSGLVEQSRSVLAAQAPEIKLFDLRVDRQSDKVRSGGVFVTTWSSVATSSVESRRSRTRDDDGLSVDELILLARAEGVRIGCVVDEAHHGFHRAAQARVFFKAVLAPDYALMMTATPRDADLTAFEADTGYTLGGPADWASVSRTDAVEAGLLKRGVRMVRFIASDDNLSQLLSFERIALNECAKAHRNIQHMLEASGIPLTPLMLVQVPNGRDDQESTRQYLVEVLGFSANAVKVHTSDEPDPELLSLANDSTVEVLIFKMAVAIGFDAPRAFTLAALRGARDAGFGVQVIGRILRRHSLLQGRGDLPPELEHGYVFLANSASQEGLLTAGHQINEMTTQAPSIGTQTVITVLGGAPELQVVRTGESLQLWIDSEGVTRTGNDDGQPIINLADISESEVEPDISDKSCPEFNEAVQGAFGLLELATNDADTSTNPAPPSNPEQSILPLLNLESSQVYRYPRASIVPAMLKAENKPKLPQQFEEAIADHVDFNETVLATRLKSRIQIHRNESSLFDDAEGEHDEDIYARLPPEYVARRAENLRLKLVDSNDRELQPLLLERFRSSLERNCYDYPEDEELLLQQLDLVMVRNPSILREAYRRVSLSRIVDVDVALPGEISSELKLMTAKHNAYGCYPADLNLDELAVAKTLDASPLVLWWHRNPVKRPESVSLYRWDDGKGYYPDFVVAVKSRPALDQIALLEVKGGHMWANEDEVGKYGAKHPNYGQVFMIGRRRGEETFHHLRREGDRLTTDGDFAVERLKY